MTHKWIIAPILSGLLFSSLIADEVIQPVTTDVPAVVEPSTKLGTELAMLDDLIEVTQQNLDSLQQLRTLLREYLEIHVKYAENTSDRQLSYQMILKAHEVIKKIKENHLTQAFDQDLISELTFFSNIAAKWNDKK